MKSKNPVIELENASLVGASKHRIFMSDWTCASGCFVGVLGKNGAGKSSLLSMISGEHNYQGSAKFLAKELSQWSLKEKAWYMAYLPQQSHLSFAFSAEEVVRLGRSPFDSGLATDTSIVLEVMTMLQCEDMARINYLELSGGEQQRIHIARVLTQLWQGHWSDKLLILDEPLNSLDYRYQKLVISLLRELVDKGLTVVASFHDINVALRHCDELLLLKNGELYEKGDARHVSNEALLKEVFDTHLSVSPCAKDGGHRVNIW